MGSKYAEHHGNSGLPNSFSARRVSTIFPHHLSLDMKDNAGERHLPLALPAHMLMCVPQLAQPALRTKFSGFFVCLFLFGQRMGLGIEIMSRVS